MANDALNDVAVGGIAPDTGDVEHARSAELERRVFELECTVATLSGQIDALVASAAAPPPTPVRSSAPGMSNASGRRCAGPAGRNRLTNHWSTSLPAADAVSGVDQVADSVGRSLIEIMHGHVGVDGPADPLVLAGLARQTARLAALIETLERSQGDQAAETDTEIRTLTLTLDSLSARLDRLERKAQDRRPAHAAKGSNLKEVLFGTSSSTTARPSREGRAFGELVARLDRVAAPRNKLS